MLVGLKRRVEARAGAILRRMMSGDLPQTAPGLEPVYQRVFEREIGRLNLQDDYFPVGSAANYGLLYLILRIVKELKPQSVMELGAGQSTLLLDALAKAGHLEGAVLTFEHDPAWASRIGGRVAHEVRSVPLGDGHEGGSVFRGYNPTELPASGSVQLAIVDGPPAGAPEIAFSRLGFLRMLDCLDPGAFAVIVDDSERRGEVRLCELVEERLSARGIPYRRGAVVASKRQDVICGGRLEAAAYF